MCLLLGLGSALHSDLSCLFDDVLCEMTIGLASAGQVFEFNKKRSGRFDVDHQTHWTQQGLCKISENRFHFMCVLQP